VTTIYVLGTLMLASAGVSLWHREIPWFAFGWACGLALGLGTGAN
jgi:hypothetical protein